MTINIVKVLDFRNTSQRHNYGHYSDVQLVIGGEGPQTYVRHVWVEPPAHRRSAGKPPHKKLSL